MQSLVIQTVYFQIPITLSTKKKYYTRCIMHFEIREQTLRLRLVSEPVDEYIFIYWNSADPYSAAVAYTSYLGATAVDLLYY